MRYWTTFFFFLQSDCTETKILIVGLTIFQCLKCLNRSRYINTFHRQDNISLTARGDENSVTWKMFFNRLYSFISNI